LAYRNKEKEHARSEHRKIDNKDRSPKELQQVIQRMCWFRYDSKDGNQYSTPCNKNSADYHPWGEYIAEKETSKEGIPE